MATIVNNPPSSDNSGSPATMIVVVVVLLVLIVLAFVYVLPSLRQTQPEAEESTEIIVPEIPDEIDVNIQQEGGEE